MSYFKNFPTLFYEGDYKRQLVTALDITIRAKIIDLISNTQGSVVEYDIDDGERPEHIAHRVYGKPDYHWTILMYNEIHDPFFEWPMSSYDLMQYVDEKYKGVAYFIDMKTASSQYPKDLWFEVGPATINEIPIDITDWNPNLFKITASEDAPQNSSFTSSEKKILTQTRSDGRVLSVEVKRIVDSNIYAVHHFIDEDTKAIVDHHLLNSDYSVQRDLGENNIGYEIVNLSFLDRYVYNSNDIIPLSDRTILPITNINYEIDLNDKKRKIKVMRPQYVDIIVKDMKKVLLGG
jgi:hypothetical protein